MKTNEMSLFFLVLVLAGPVDLAAQTAPHGAFAAAFETLRDLYPDETYAVVLDGEFPTVPGPNSSRSRLDEATNRAFANHVGLPAYFMEDVLLCPDGTARSCSLAGDITSIAGFFLETLEGDRATVLMKVMTEVNVERAPVFSSLYRAELQRSGDGWEVVTWKQVWVS